MGTYQKFFGNNLKIKNFVINVLMYHLYTYILTPILYISIPTFDVVPAYKIIENNENSTEYLLQY